MKNKVGIWIDHQHAFLVFIQAGVESSQHIESGMDKDVRYTGRTIEEDGKADDQRDSHYASHLNQYYDQVIANLHDAEAILLFGPGEAKIEFKKRLMIKDKNAHVVGVDTVDKMTEPQVLAKVREFYVKDLAI
ncbi:hypothetical protein [Methylomonas sp. AM2-LC]|uniref:hypothetical protein n=1 Tax=Methylomonas sp. AM2-LC TaxID=3153301 RepID=UPI0032667F4F